MRKFDHLQQAHELFQDWASWVIRHPNGISILGTQVSQLDNIRSGLPPGPIVPDDLMPSRIGIIDSLMADLETPQTHRIVLKIRYLGPPDKAHLVSRNKLRSALEFASGVIRGHKLDMHA